MQANEKPRKPPGENVVESDNTNQTFQFQQWFEVNSSNPKGEVNLVNCVNSEEEEIRWEEQNTSELDQLIMSVKNTHLTLTDD